MNTGIKIKIFLIFLLLVICVVPKVHFTIPYIEGLSPLEKKPKPVAGFIGFWQSVVPDKTLLLQFKEKHVVFLTKTIDDNSNTISGTYKIEHGKDKIILNVNFTEKQKNLRMIYLPERNLIKWDDKIFKTPFELWGIWKMKSKGLEITLKIRNFYRFTEITEIRENIIKRKGYCEIKQSGKIKYVQLNYDNGIPAQLIIKRNKNYDVILVDYKSRVYEQINLY